jgi:hypothetical protein
MTQRACAAGLCAGDSDFSLAEHLDRWAQWVEFVFGMANNPTLRRIAEGIDESVWTRLRRRLAYQTTTGKIRVVVVSAGRWSTAYTGGGTSHGSSQQYEPHGHRSSRCMENDAATLNQIGVARGHPRVLLGRRSCETVLPGGTLVTEPRAFLSFDFDHDAQAKILFAGQCHAKSPTPFTAQDWSSKEALPQQTWEQTISEKISRTNMVIVLVGKHMASATGVAKEIAMACHGVSNGRRNSVNIGKWRTLSVASVCPRSSAVAAIR